MSTVEIEYCVPCGHRENALATADAILDAAARRIDGVELVPGDGGIFQVRVDGEVVFDTDERGYDREEIVAAVTDRAATA